MESNEIFGSTVSAQDAAKEPVAEKKKAGRKPKTASEKSTVKKATPVKTAEVKDEKPVVTEKKKPGRKPKTASEKPAETKKPAAKTTATKKTTAKKTTAKKTTAKVAAKNTVYIQFNGRQVDYDEVLKKVAADCKKQKASSKDVTLYIKPEDNACYYVANNGIAGKVDLY
ncbi:MAG: DUF6465 family protein [Lachnospira sp.]|nr:DUF6465 family protein [Lachnospira sp.]